MSAPVPAPLQGPAPTHTTHTPFATQGPGPSRKEKEWAQVPPIPTPTAAEDPKYLIAFYNTKLGNAFGDPKMYARRFPHSYEAGEYRGGAYNVSSLTPGHLHPENNPSPSYAQAASGSAAGSKEKKKAGKQPSPKQVASGVTPLVKKGSPSLAGAQRRFFAPRQSPAPHPDAPSIAATFPEIAAGVLRESNCLLPLGFSATVNPRGGISLTVTDKATPAASYAPYFVPLTSALNQSFPVGDNPWWTLVLAPTAVQRTIHGLPLRFLPQDEQELFPYIRQAILNHKATPVLSARYLNPDGDSRSAKQATSVVVTVDPQYVSALTSGVFILSQKPNVVLAFSANQTPSVETVGDTDTPTKDAPPPTQCAPFVRFTLLVRLTDVRISPAPGAGTLSQSHPVVRPAPPIAATVVMTTLPHSKNVRLDLTQLAPPHLPPQSHQVKTPWIWWSMAVQHPLLPRPGRVPLRWTS